MLIFCLDIQCAAGFMCKKSKRSFANVVYSKKIGITIIIKFLFKLLLLNYGLLMNKFKISNIKVLIYTYFVFYKHFIFTFIRFLKVTCF